MTRQDDCSPHRRAVYRSPDKYEVYGTIEAPNEHNPAVPSTLSRVIMTALSRDVVYRYPDAETMRNALVNALAPGPACASSRPMNRFGIAAAALVIMAIPAWLYVTGRELHPDSGTEGAMNENESREAGRFVRCSGSAAVPPMACNGIPPARFCGEGGALNTFEATSGVVTTTVDGWLYRAYDVRKEQLCGQNERCDNGRCVPQ